MRKGSELYNSLINDGKYFVLNDNDHPQFIHFTLEAALNDNMWGGDYIDVFNADGVRIGDLAHISKVDMSDEERESADWSWTLDH